MSMKYFGVSKKKDMWETAGMFKAEGELFPHIKPGNLLQRQSEQFCLSEYHSSIT